MRLPDGKDPDEVVREAPAHWEAASRRPTPRRIPHRPPCRRFDLKTTNGRIGFVEAVMPAFRDIADPLRRDEALQEVLRLSGWRNGSFARCSIGGSLRPGESGRGARSPTRITADAVLASPDALPVGDGTFGRGQPGCFFCGCSCCLPEQQLRVVDELGPDQLSCTFPASCTGRSCWLARRMTTGSISRINSWRL